MNPNDMLLLTNPAGLAAVIFGLIACARAMLAKGILQPQIGFVEGFAGANIAGQLRLNDGFILRKFAIRQRGCNLDSAGLTIDGHHIRLHRFQRHQQRQRNCQQGSDAASSAGNDAKANHSSALIITVPAMASKRTSRSMRARLSTENTGEPLRRSSSGGCTSAPTCVCTVAKA